MVDLAKAREIADKFVISLNKDIHKNIEFGVLHNAVKTIEGGWMFTYNSREYIETNSMDSFIMGTILFAVSQEDGSLHFAGDKGKLSIFLKKEMNKE
jgi:hypothetical protein